MIDRSLCTGCDSYQRRAKIDRDAPDATSGGPSAVAVSVCRDSVLVFECRRAMSRFCVEGGLVFVPNSGYGLHWQLRVAVSSSLAPVGLSVVNRRSKD